MCSLYPLGQKEIPNRSSTATEREFESIIPKNLPQESKANFNVHKVILKFSLHPHITLTSLM
jgi:hypothetical protein